MRTYAYHFRPFSAFRAFSESIYIFLKHLKSRKKRGLELFSLSLAVHVSPEGRWSEVAGARLARRDKISRKLLFLKFQKQRNKRKFGAY